MAVERDLQEDGVRVPEVGTPPPDTGSTLKLAKGYPPVLGAMLLIDGVAALVGGYRATVSLGEAVAYVLLPLVAMVLVGLPGVRGGARAGPRAGPVSPSFVAPDAALGSGDAGPIFGSGDAGPIFGSGDSGPLLGSGDSGPLLGSGDAGLVVGDAGRRSRVRWLVAAGAAAAALFAALFLGGGIHLVTVPAWAEAATGAVLLALTALLFAPRRQHVGRRRAQ
jgi:hypothetical protein